MEDGAEVGMDDPIFNRPLRVRKVMIVGNHRTQNSVIEQELVMAKEARTVREVSTGIMHALRSLKQSECFDAVEVYCDVAPKGKKKHTSNNREMEYTDVTVSVREKRIVSLKAETYVTGSGSDGGVESSVTLNNPLGYTEKVNAAVAYGTKSSTSSRVEFIKPKLQGLPVTLNLTASQNTASRALFSSYDEKIRALEATLRHNGGKHEFGVGTAWRDIIPIRDEKNVYKFAASGLIIAQAKPTLKNSLRYTFTNDKRNDPFGPTTGSLFQLNSEVAGFGGDVSFLKGHVKMQQFMPVLEGILPGSSMGISFHAGMVYPLGDFEAFRTPNSKQERAVGASTSLSDRFWLGGPMTFRGFNHKGVGPRTSPKRPGAKGGDSLGGDIVWTLGYSLYLPFPHSLLNAAGMRCHLYANAGNLCAWETSFRTVLNGMRASVGAGVVFPTAIGRFEANYSFVLRANSRDQQRRFQLGLGMDFL